MLHGLVRSLRICSSCFEGAPAIEESKDEDFIPENENKIAPAVPNKLHPRIKWPELSPITYGDALQSDVQLIAIAKDFKSRIVEGSFVYCPPVGTILDAGIHTLTVTFVPKKSYKYYSAEGTQDLFVRKRAPIVMWDIPVDEILYSDELTEDFFQPQCELSDGRFFFSHEVGTILEIGLHTMKVEYEPSAEEAKNFSRGFATVQLRVRGAPIPLKWDIPYSQDAHRVVLRDNMQRLQSLNTVDEESSTGGNSDDGNSAAGASYKRRRRGGISSSTGKSDSDLKADGSRKDFIEAAIDLPSEKRSSAFCAGAPLIYPDQLPSWLFNAEPLPVMTKQGLEEVTGRFEYEPGPKTVLPAGTHTLTATFYPDDTRRFRVSTITRRIPVLKSPVPLEWPQQIGMTEGDTLDERTLNCSNRLNVQGTYTYDPPSGTALLEGDHELHVLFEPHDKVNYNNSTAVSEFRVRPKRTPMLHWPQPPDIVHPFPLSKLQLNATLRGAYYRGTWTYYPPANAILDAGVHTLTATFTPEKPTVRVVSVSVQLTVQQGLSRMIWDTPEPLYEGQGLYDASLNCKCTNLRGGKFIYKPPKGTVLPVGVHRLRCHYIPKDKNYMEAYSFVKQTILPRPQSKYQI